MPSTTAAPRITDPIDEILSAIDQEVTLDARWIHESITTRLADELTGWVVSNRDLELESRRLTVAIRLAVPVQQLLAQAANELWPMNRYRQGLADVLANYRALHGEDRA